MNIIHETAVSDVINFISNGTNKVNNSVANVDKALRGSNKAYYSSISSAAKNLTLEFPVMVSNTMDITTANMISKAIERNAITMLQLLFAANSVTADNAYELISQFHTNLKSNYSVDDFISVVSNECTNNFNLSREDYEAIREDTKNIFTVLPDSISESSIGDFTVRERYGKLNVLKEEPFQPVPASMSIFTDPDSITNGWIYMGSDSMGEKIDIDKTIGVRKDMFAARKNRRDENLYALSKNRDDREKDEFEYKKNNRDKLDNQNDNLYNDKRAYTKHQLDYGRQKMEYDQNEERRSQFRNARDRDIHNLNMAKGYQGMVKTDMDMTRNLLVDTEVKKSNEMAPSLMIAKFNDERGFDRAFVIGVKARLIPISSADIMDRIITKNKDNLGFLNLIRATTREISFVKDFLLAINKAKVDTLAYSRRGSTNPMWKVLERRAIKSKWNKYMKNKKIGADLIATLVVTEQEADQIKKIANMDISRIHIAKSLMESYSLMCLVIVDEISESVRFLNDGSDYFETLSFNNLERENNGNKDYKKIVNLLSKNAR